MEVKDMKIKSKRISKVTVFICVFLWLAALHPWGMSAEDKEITIAAVGDCLIFNKVSFYKDPEFLQMWRFFVKPTVPMEIAKPRFSNRKTVSRPIKNLTQCFLLSLGADELKWLGIDLVSVANNHIMDFDYAGMFSTLENLDRVGIVYAGAGKTFNKLPGRAISRPTKVRFL